MKIPFVKMHGLGNDFVVIHDIGKPSSEWAPITPALARKLCDRRFGVGADQILWLKSPMDSSADARMEILNADGSTAEMCGNGIRAVALYLKRYGAKKADSYRIETLGGLKPVLIKEGLVTVDMGPPALGKGPEGQAGEILELPGGQKFRFCEVSMGNPHAVIFVKTLDDIRLEETGPIIENHPRFPNRTNVEFVQVESLRSIRVRVWERGAGVTLACGTGACASAVATIVTSQGVTPIDVHLPGGKLTLSWGGAGQSVFMEGPAEEVFRGEYFINGQYSITG